MPLPTKKKKRDEQNKTLLFGQTTTTLESRQPLQTGSVARRRRGCIRTQRDAGDFPQGDADGRYSLRVSGLEKLASGQYTAATDLDEVDAGLSRASSEIRRMACDAQL